MIKIKNEKKPYYYKDIIDYIKNQNKNITQIKLDTKNIYQNILQQHLFTINTSNTNKNITKLRITVIQIIIFEIWQSRNNYKFEHKLLPQQTTINKINAQLNSILLLHYKKHKLQHSRNFQRTILYK